MADRHTFTYDITINIFKKEVLTMKKFIKIVSVLLSLVITVFSFSACNKSETTPSGKEKDSYKIGIIQYVSHPSLDNCYQGIMDAINASDLKDKITVDRQIGSDASADTDCATYAKNMVAAQYDLILAIATPAATSAYAATTGTNIPVVFCAVNDPVAAELVQSLEKPGDLCTGTSDVLDLDAQVKMIQKLQPDVKDIGILYTTSESNSISNLQRFKEICGQLNINVEAVGVQNASDIPSAATSLAGKVDCINNFTDNNVVNNLSIVLDAAKTAGIPVYGSEVEQVKNGCLASVSIDYVALGKTTGDMALDVLKGADITTMSVKTIGEASTVINTDVLGALNMKEPADIGTVEHVTTNK